MFSYDKEAIEGRLVETAHLVVYAWQTQQVICKKCRRAKHANLSKFCKCSGDWYFAPLHRADSTPCVGYAEYLEWRQ